MTSDTLVECIHIVYMLLKISGVESYFQVKESQHCFMSVNLAMFNGLDESEGLINAPLPMSGISLVFLSL